MAFGPGDISANDWGFSGGNTFWTNWSTTTFSNGGLGRVNSVLRCRWGTNSSSTTGHNNIWGSGNARAATTGNFSVTTGSTGAYNVATVSPNPTWLSSDSFYGGMWRTASQTSTTPFRDGSGGNYAGKSADDGTNSGGTTNWAGVGNPGGMGWSVDYTVSAVFVRRGGAWVRCAVYVRRSGAWTQCPVFVRRGGAWTTVALHRYLNETGEHIPEKGMPVEVSYDGGDWESGWIVEADTGWFGPGDLLEEGFNPRYNTEEPADLVEDRAILYYEWQKAVKEEHVEYAEELAKALWPTNGKSGIILPARKTLARV